MTIRNISKTTYNGLGNRLQQSHNGQTTTYALDLNAELPQVLSDGAYTYLYGYDRIAQSGASGMEYFLPDALASVRQMTDGVGGVTLSQSFSPYGELLARGGIGSTAYDFAGEWTDPSGLQYLRARYYAPSTGTFISRDPWSGNVRQPASLNRYMYVQGNPIGYIDPSGYLAEKDESLANKIEAELLKYNVFVNHDWGRYGGIWIAGNWELYQLEEVRIGVVDLASSLGGYEQFILNIGGKKRVINFVAKDTGANNSTAQYRFSTRNIEINLQANLPPDHRLGAWAVVHELAHKWDDNSPKIKRSSRMQECMGAYFPDPTMHKLVPDAPEFWYNPGRGMAAAGIDKNLNPEEDFAESVTAHVYPGAAKSNAAQSGYMGEYSYEDFNSQPRGVYMGFLFGAIQGNLFAINPSPSQNNLMDSEP